MTVLAWKRRALPAWWIAFTDAHPAVPNLVALAGLVAILYLLAPGVSHPSGRGEMIDSLSAVVKSDTVVGRAVSLRAAYHQRVPKDVRDYVGKIVFYPALYVVVPFLMLLEFLFPCKPSQPIVGKGFLQDAIWFAALTPTTILVLAAANEFLRHLFGTACPSRDVYPDTGVNDARFPSEEHLTVSQLPANWLRQTVYPFVQLFAPMLPRPLRGWRAPLSDRALTDTQKA